MILLCKLLSVYDYAVMMTAGQGNDSNFVNKVLSQHTASSLLTKPNFKGKKVRDG